MQMKTVISLIVIVVVVFVGYSFYESETKPLKEKRFELYEAEFRKEIEILKRNQDTMKRSLKRLEKNVDTLKTGQGVIYRTIKEGATKRDFLSEILNQF